MKKTTLILLFNLISLGLLQDSVEFSNGWQIATIHGEEASNYWYTLPAVGYSFSSDLSKMPVRRLAILCIDNLIGSVNFVFDDSQISYFPDELYYKTDNDDVAIANGYPFGNQFTFMPDWENEFDGQKIHINKMFRASLLKVGVTSKNGEIITASYDLSALEKIITACNLRG